MTTREEFEKEFNSLCIRKQVMNNSSLEGWDNTIMEKNWKRDFEDFLDRYVPKDENSCNFVSLPPISTGIEDYTYTFTEDVRITDLTFRKDGLEIRGHTISCDDENA